MTYLEIVNKVLRLLREPAAVSTSDDDAVVLVVAEMVNDAKRTVEDAHNWNALRYEWSETATANNQHVELTAAGKDAKVDYIYTTDGTQLRDVPNQQIAAMRANSTDPGMSWYYAVNGLSNGNLRLRLYPAPKTDTGLEVYGYKKQADLSSDADVLLVPEQPVIYLALALAARERGEVGGQTAAEVFQMAGTYLKDAIANDVALNQYEYDFYVG